jgi:hypothetical protein
MKNQKRNVVVVIILALIIIFGIVIFNNIPNEKIVKNNIETNSTNTSSEMIKQANEMAQSLISKDYERFSNFAYPKIVSALGGKDKYIQIMKNADTKDTILSKVTIGEPSVIVDTGTELQSVVPQTLEIKIPTGLLVSQGALIAISSDKGNSWYFIDTGGNGIERIRMQLPNISKNLIIPDSKQPVLIKNQ